AVERSGHTLAGAALGQLQAAVGAAVLVERGRVAAGAEGRRRQRNRRKLHWSITTGITIGWRWVRRQITRWTASWAVSLIAAGSGSPSNPFRLSITAFRASASTATLESSSMNPREISS